MPETEIGYAPSVRFSPQHKRRVGIGLFTVALLVGAIVLMRPRAARDPLRAEPAVIPTDAAFLLIGGGADPDSTHVSMDQDLHALQGALHGKGVTLFAAGRDIASVQRLREGEDRSLRGRLAGIKELRELRRADLALPSLHVDGPARAEEFVFALDSLLARTGPLLLWFSTHGGGGEHPAMSTLPLWGQFAVSVGGLAEMLDEGERETRFMITACHGGGFAEMIYRGAEAEGGYATKRCGFFATPFNDEAAGCDSNPDRGAQESYAKHVVTALSDRASDLNRDGRVTLREAHTVARARSRSIDRPFATSDYLLAQLDLVPGDDSDAPAEDPARDTELTYEERWLILALSHELGLRDRAAADARFEELETELDALDLQSRELESNIDDAYALLRISLLERFPWVDDPWRADYSRRLDENAPEIEAVLGSSIAERYRRTVAVLQALLSDHDERRAEWAQVDRLLSAYATRDRASVLRARGGEDFAAFERFLACERATLDEASMISATGDTEVRGR